MEKKGRKEIVIRGIVVLECTPPTSYPDENKALPRDPTRGREDKRYIVGDWRGETWVDISQGLY